MNAEQRMVQEFHRKFEQRVGVPTTSPHWELPNGPQVQLRYNLLAEELGELREALAQQKVVQIAKELADLLYVTYGTAVVYGIDMEPVFAAVHASNMGKEGGHFRDDGKWVKPDTHQTPNIEAILQS